MDKTLETKIVELLDQLQAIAPKAGKQAVEMALVDTRVTAIGNLVLGAALLVLTLWLIRKASKWFSVYIGDRYDAEELHLAGAIFGSILALVCGIASLICLLDIWNWVGAFNPEAGLAHRLIQAIGGKG